MTDKPISRRTNIAVQELEAEILIYDFKIDKAFCLNQTIALVYNLADGTKTVAEISESLSSRLKIPVSEDLVWLALDQLKENGLLENNETFRTNSNELTRRQIIKRVGLGSMIMLPVVSSIVAPNAAMAASQSIALLGICPSVGGSGCAAGTHCTNCLAGCPNGNGPTCCANSHPTVSRGPRQPTVSSGACNTESTCATLGEAECCSGSAAWTFNGCGNLGTGGTCICN